jgi:shikimate dehydrogenase
VVGALEALGAEGKSWLIAGTGGSAIAVAAAAARSGARVAVCSRSEHRAAQFLERARLLGASVADPAECEVVINATPLGLGPQDPLPLSPEVTPAARFALDLVYAAGETSWVRAMRAAGVRAADGREVLVRQGAAAFQRWFPRRAAPVEVMRAAVRAGLG